MNRWLSRRHPRYIRSLVYMLQASEYNIADFFRWHERTQDFRVVERRKELKFTLKATALIVVGWVSLLGAFLLAGYVYLNFPAPWGIIVAVIVLLETPLFALLGVIAALFIGRAMQAPVEYILLWEATRSLARHKGVKIAIAGSYGKTSTREILRTVLSEGKKVAAPGESFNTPLAIAKFVRSLAIDEDILIFELGEYYPGDVRKLARVIKPDWGVITGANEAHLEKFGTLEHTIGTIFELTEFIEASHLYVNGDDERVRVRTKSGNTVYSRAGAGAWGVSDATTDLSGTAMKLSKDGKTHDATSKLFGLHMIGPLLLAADIATRLGLKESTIITGIAKTKPFAHRLERKDWGDGVTFIDDSYNGNPDGVRAAITFLASLNGRRIYVTPGLVEAGPRVQQVHEEIGRQLATSGIEKVALIDTSVARHIRTGLNSSGFKGAVKIYPDMPSCLAALKAEALPGDVILVQNDWPDQYA